MKITQSEQGQLGFSLIELLTVVAIIGVLAAIALPSIGSLSGSANDAKDQRNAQDIVTNYTMGSAAGVVWPSGDVAAKVAAVIAGRKPPSGVFANSTFRSMVTPSMAVTTYRFIGIRANGDLSFNPDGGQNASGH